MDKKNKVLTRIITPTNVFFEEHIDFVTVKIADGYATFLPNHSPKISVIQPSTLTLEITPGVKKRAVILDGIISVSPSHIQIITNEIYWDKDIWVKETEKRLQELEAKMVDTSALTKYELIVLKNSIKKQEAKLKTSKGDE